MNHQDATQSMAVEKYVLNELTPELRAEFEEHYFECAECAMDLRATTAFLDAAKAEFKAASATKRLPVAAPKTQRTMAMEAFHCHAGAGGLPAFHCVSKHGGRSAVTPADCAIQLARGFALGLTDRWGQPRRSIPSIDCSSCHPFLLLMDIPTQDRFSTYTCSLYSPTGKLAWQVHVSAQQAKDTISITHPGGRQDGWEIFAACAGKHKSFQSRNRSRSGAV